MRIGNGAVLLLSGLLFTGCLQGNPEFLEEGKSYYFSHPENADWGFGADLGEVIEYDRKTGWVYVKVTQISGEITKWINLNYVVSIRPFK